MLTTGVRHFTIHNWPKRGSLRVPRRARPILNSELPDPGLFPIAGELQGALADGGAEGLVRREGGETFGLRVDLGSQDVMLTQSLTLRISLKLRHSGHSARKRRLLLSFLQSRRNRPQSHMTISVPSGDVRACEVQSDVGNPPLLKITRIHFVADDEVPKFFPTIDPIEFEARLIVPM